MLRILGSNRRLCDGLSRRELLRAGGLSLLGLSAADLLKHETLHAGEAAAAGGFGQAKACILLYLYGAPSQLETYDPKPDAPVEIRGEFTTIDSAVPGMQVCEYLPNLARVLDRAAVVRSMTHPYNIHSAAYALTGVPQVDIPMELNPYDSRHWPFIGSVLDYLERRDRPGLVREVPGNVGLPFQFSSRCGEFARGGPYGGFLGQAHNPVWTEFEGKSTAVVNRWRGERDVPVDDPYLGISPSDRFVLSRAAQLQPEITLDRLSRRRDLLAQFDLARRQLDAHAAVETQGRFQQMAFSLMTSPAVRSALDIQQEPAALREQYGMTLFGQATLAARRLIEAGSRLVTVFWDEYTTANSAWDTHFDHFTRLKDELLPGLDRAFSGLVLDLESRGMLDTTLVACISEHGRTPQITNSRGGGREHWSRAYGGLFAGGGIKRGAVVGRTDKHGGDVVDRPVSPKDILATIYHLLGVDAGTMLHDRLGRPLPLVAEGHVVREIVV
ncbi:MAG TPA: DUF1501 domain-containing protein [Pirellulales bacterium]|nr:DUF1501 domain-containing protein [Pirellulales bacterium]